MADAPQEPAIELKPGDIGIFFGTGKEQGRIVLAFYEPVKWIALDPLNASNIAKELLDKCLHLGVNIRLVLPRKELSPIKYQTLVTRVGLVMKNQLEKNVNPKLVARQLVDIVLSGADL